MSDNRTLLQKRRGLCLKLAEEIERHFELHNIPGRKAAYDIDEAAVVIDQHLPLTYAEADAEMAETAEDLAPLMPPGPSLSQQLYDALGLTRDVGIRGLLQSAVEAAVERDRLRVALDGVECLEFRRGWLAEADAIWAARESDVRPTYEVILWATRCREMLLAAIEAHAPLDGRDEEVAAARRRLGKAVAQ